MSTDTELTGKLIYAGALTVEGEQLNGVFIECDPEALRNAKVPLYREVFILEDPRHAIFGRLMWEMIQRIGGDFCESEWSEDILPLAEKAGLCRRVAYDPKKHGDDIEAEPGSEIWWWGPGDGVSGGKQS